MTELERNLKFESLIRIAETEIGQEENPQDSNMTKYGEWFGLNGVPWCGIFVSWCYDKAGITLPKIGFSKPGFAGTQTAMKYFRENKLLVTDPIPGDIVFFDWNNNGRVDHCGIYVGGKINNRASYYVTIEGNTSQNNNSNGGEVMKRYRSINRSRGGIFFARINLI